MNRGRLLLPLSLLLAAWTCLLALHGKIGLVMHDEGMMRLLQSSSRRLSLLDKELHHEIRHDLPPFSMRIKIVHTSHPVEDYRDFVAKFQVELEAVVTEHVASVIHEDLPGLPIELQSKLLPTRHSDHEAILEANFTGSITFTTDTLTPYSPAQLFALMKRAFLTKEEYTRLVDRLHRSRHLPVVRGVKVTLLTTPQSAEKITTAHGSGFDEETTFRVVAFLSMGALLSIALYFIDFMTRPKRKNWKAKKRRKGLLNNIKSVFWLRDKSKDDNRRSGALDRRAQADQYCSITQRRRSRSSDREVMLASDPLLNGGRRAQSHHMRLPPSRSMSSSDHLYASAAVLMHRKTAVARSNSFDPTSSAQALPYRASNKMAIGALISPRRGRKRLVQSASSLLVTSGDGNG